MRKSFYIFLTIGFIFFWFYLVDFAKVVKILQQASLQFIVYAIFIGIIITVLTNLRLQAIMSLIGQRIPFIYLLTVNFFTSLLSTIFPFSAGGFVLAYLLAKKIKQSYIRVFSLLFFDYLLVVVPIVLLGPIAVYYFLTQGIITLALDTISWNSILLIVVFSILALTILGFIYRKAEKIKNQAKSLFSLLLQSKVVLFQVALLTVVMVFFGNLSSYLYFLAFDMHPNIIAFVLAGALIGILNILPGTPMKIGQQEVIGVLTLPYLLHVDKDRIFAMLLVSHVIGIVITILCGIWAQYVLGFDLTMLKKFEGLKKKRI